MGKVGRETGELLSACGFPEDGSGPQSSQIRKTEFSRYTGGPARLKTGDEDGWTRPAVLSGVGQVKVSTGAKSVRRKPEELCGGSADGTDSEAVPMQSQLPQEDRSAAAVTAEEESELVQQQEQAFVLGQVRGAVTSAGG